MNLRGPLVLSVVLALLAAPTAATAPRREPRPRLDVRVPTDPASAGGFVLRRPSAAQVAAAAALARAIPGLELRWDGMSGSPKRLAAGDGTLAPPAASNPRDAARIFLLDNAALFGLVPGQVGDLDASSVVPGARGGFHVHFVQKLRGLEVFGGHAHVILTAGLAVRSVASSLYGGDAAPSAPRLDAVEALRIALSDVYPESASAVDRREARRDGDRRTLFSREGFGRPPEARLVLVPVADGFVLAWSIEVAEPSFRTDYRVVLDAASGEILYRVNRTNDAVARVLDAGHPDPQGEEWAPPQHVMRPIPTVTSASPSGWIEAGGANLRGNNAETHLLDITLPGPTEPSGIYDYPFQTDESAVANAWWWVNDMHDRLYALGFDEASGNFQQDNFGHGGLANDPVHILAVGADGRNNAYSSTDVDGNPPTLGFFWNDCRCGEHDGYAENGGERHAAFDRGTVFHEFGHSVSRRLVGGPTNPDDCIFGIQSGAMNEAWSDVWAASFFNEPDDSSYFVPGRSALRDLRNDLGYDELCKVGNGSCEVHDDGMLWAATLWELRRSLVALDPAGGLDVFHRLIVEGQKSTPCHPTMLDARDGMLDADAALFGGTHQRPIWNVFASRGMGQTASSTGENDTAPVVNTTVPAGFTCSPPAAPTSVTATPQGANAIRLNFTAAGAASVEIWREDLDVAWDRRGRIADTTSATTFLDTTVQGGKSYRYHVVALGGGGSVCRSAASATADATATGSCQAPPRFSPALTITDGAASCALTLAWTAASEGCPGSGAPIVYDVYRAPVPGLDLSDSLLIGRTTATTFQDVPPQDGEVPYYLVLAQHGTLADPVDSTERGSAQVIRWVPKIPTLGRTLVQSWDFESGAQSWTAQNFFDLSGPWTRVTPHGTRYGDVQFAPDEASGGAGFAWVTGDAVSPNSIAERDADGGNLLISPIFDGRNGATYFSFDYWAHIGIFDALTLRINNGSQEVVASPVQYLTVQTFDSPARYGWQRAEVDLASYVTPTATMRVTFVPSVGNVLSEFGVDNVRVERATGCSRAALRINSVAVDDTPAGWGNGNGILDPGETARLTLTLLNGGTATALSPSATISSPTAGVLVHEATSSFANIPPSSTGSSTAPAFTVTVPGSEGCGDTPTFEFDVTEAAGTRVTLPWSPETGLSVTDQVFADTFETDKGWIAEGGTVGHGVWQRGDPVGTTVAAVPANPENDSPNDAGSQCYATENGPPGGGPDANDVDAVQVGLYSPLIDLTSYKRSRLLFDLWYYDSSASVDFEDYGDFGAYNDEGGPRPTFGAVNEFDLTNGWQPRSLPLHLVIAPASNVRVYFHALDRDATWIGGGLDHTVEMAVDNVRVEGDRFVCGAPTATHPPAGIGSSLRLDKSGGTVQMTWTASPVDPGHDAAAFYTVHASGAPNSGFGAADTTTGPSSSEPLAGGNRFFLISATNAVGTSGDEP